MSALEYVPHPDDAEEYKPWSVDAEPVEIAPGVYLPSRLVDRPLTDDELDAMAAGLDHAQTVIMRISVGVHMEMRDFVYAITRIEIQAHGGESINGKLLRALAVSDLIEDPIRLAARVRRPDGKLARYETHALRRAAALDGPTDENLISAARVYAIGHAMQIRPTAAVEDALGLKRSTAENWVRRAKDKGYVFAEA